MMLPLVRTLGSETGPAVVLGAAVEQGAGDLGGGGAGLGRPVVELGDLEVAVAVDARQLHRRSRSASRTSRCCRGRSRRPGRCRRSAAAGRWSGRSSWRRGGSRSRRMSNGIHVDAGAVVGEAGVVVDVAGVELARNGLSGSRMKFRYEVGSSKPTARSERRDQLVSIVAGPVELPGQRAAVVGAVGEGDQGVGVPDGGGVDADQAGLVAVGGCRRGRRCWGWSGRRPG